MRELKQTKTRVWTFHPEQQVSWHLLTDPWQRRSQRETMPHVYNSVGLYRVEAVDGRKEKVDHCIGINSG